MKKIFALIFISALTAPFQSMACISNQVPEIEEHIRFYPIVGDKTSHWPEEVNAVLGSYLSFLVPVDTKIEIVQRKDGPLVQLNEAKSKLLLVSRYVVPAWDDIEYDTKKFKWVHFASSTYGNSELRMHSAGGWKKSMKFVFNYQSEADQVSRPPEKLTLVAGEHKTILIDAYGNIEVTVAGKVSDGWTASPDKETGFTLIRVQQVDPIYTGEENFKEPEPQVKLFFKNNRDPVDSTMVVHQGGSLFGKRYQFKIQVIGTPAC